MQIWMLHRNPERAARFVCNEDIIPQLQDILNIVESVAFTTVSEDWENGLKTSNVFHPRYNDCVRWAAANKEHLDWLEVFARELHAQNVIRNCAKFQFGASLYRATQGMCRTAEQISWIPRNENSFEYRYFGVSFPECGPSTRYRLKYIARMMCGESLSWGTNLTPVWFDEMAKIVRDQGYFNLIDAIKNYTLVATNPDN